MDFEAGASVAATASSSFLPAVTPGIWVLDALAGFLILAGVLFIYIFIYLFFCCI